jgi:hypothetical protein
VEEAPHFNATILMRICPAPGGDQFSVMQGTLGPKCRGIVMLIPQDIVHFQGQVVEQQRSNLVVGGIGRGELSGQGDPELPKRDGQMQFPALPPAVPADLLQAASVSMLVCGTTS